MLKKSVLVLDVDNTLLDWVQTWHASFSAMLQKLEEISGSPSESLLEAIRVVHQRHGTSEYAFLIEEVPALVEAARGAPLLEFYEPALRAYRRARSETLSLYPGVSEFMHVLRSSGVLLVCYTESLSFYTGYRFRKLGLDHLVHYLYSPPDHELPHNSSPQSLRRYPAEHYRLKETHQRHTPAGELKPNPHILLSILSELRAAPHQAVYVGDSLMKDIWMAQEAGVLDAHAAYGVAQNTEAYQLLRAVSHWTDQDVERERALASSATVRPTITLENRLSDLASHVTFTKFAPQ